MSERIPPKKLKQEKKQSEDEFSRREVLRGGLAATVVSALGGSPAQAQVSRSASWAPEIIPHRSDFESLLDQGKHMRHWSEELDKFQARLRSDKEVREILRDPDPGNVRNVVRVAITEQPPCFFDMLNDETKEKIRDFYRTRALWMTSRYRGELEFIPTGRVHEGSLQLLIDTSKHGATGNAMPMSRPNKEGGVDYFIGTNAHMACLADPRPEIRRKAQQILEETSLDVIFYRASREKLLEIGINPAHAIDMSQHLPSGFNWQGFPIFGYGFDPDLGDHGPRYPLGQKEWFGMAQKVREGMVSVNHAANHSKTVAYELEAMRHHYMFVLDNGEADLRLKRARDEKGAELPPKLIRFAQGMSGCGISTMINGKVEYCGMLVMGNTAPEEGRPLPRSWASFEGKPRIMHALNDPERIFELPPRPAR